MAKDCQYLKLCKKMDRVEEGRSEYDFSYWPRDPRLYPLCRGDENPSLCMAYDYWDSHPEEIEKMKGTSRPLLAAAFWGGMSALSGLLATHWSGTDDPAKYIAFIVGTGAAAAGGLAQWIDRIDRDPQRWVRRLELARMELQAMIPY